MNNRDVRGILGEMESFIERSITPPNNGYRLIHKKRAVTRRTVRDPFAHKFFFTGDTER